MLVLKAQHIFQFVRPATRSVFVIFIAVFLLLFCSPTAFIQPSVVLSESVDSSTTKLSEGDIGRLAQVRLPFVQNHGQFANSDAAYVVNVGSGNVAVSTGEIAYDFGDVSFSELFTSDKPIAGEQGSAQVSYFLGNDESKWQSGLGSYQTVLFPNIASGIDVALQAEQGTVEKIITVDPGANPADIHFSLTPGHTLSTGENGNLLVNSGTAIYGFSPPIAWQNIGNERRAVPVAYALRGNQAYGFTVGDYDPKYALVIDPILDTLGGSTYVGGNGIGSGNDRAWTVRRKSNGQIVVAGMLKGSGLATSGAYDETVNGGTEAFIAIYNSDLSSLVALTYIGGALTEWINAIDLDSSGNVYAVGNTRSENFPTTAGADSTYNGADPGTQFDMFVLKMNSTLTSLTASTYFGGSGDDSAMFGELDSDGNFWVGGGTSAADFPVPNGGAEYDRSHNGDSDGVIAKWTSTLSTSTLTTFLGGSGYDYVSNINFDSGGDVWVSGTTYSTNFPTTGGVYDTTGDGTSGDMFIAELPATLASLSASTYFGGNGTDETFHQQPGVQFDASGNVFVVGDSSTTGLATSGVYDTTHNGGQDIILFKMNSTLTSLVALTYLGGSGADYTFGAHLSGNKIVGVFFLTFSTDLPVTAGAMDTTRSNAHSPAFFQMSSDLTSLQQLSYFMGTNPGGDDFAPSNSFDSSVYEDGLLIVSGQTGGGLPLTNNSYDSTYALNTDGFVAIIASSDDPAAPAAGHTPTYEEINPPYAPIAGSGDAFSTSTIRWNFQDRSSAEQGFEIVDSQSGTTYVTTLPIAVSNLTYLDEVDLLPGTVYCNRAVVAMNGIGKSSVSAINTYACNATLPNAPAQLQATWRDAETIAIPNTFTQETSNPETVLYGIRETTSNQWVTPVAASGTNPYVLEDAPYQDVASAWPETIYLTGIAPGTSLTFVPVASVEGRTDVLGPEFVLTYVVEPPALRVEKSVSGENVAGALITVGLVSNGLFGAGGLLFIGSVVSYGWVNRRLRWGALASMWRIPWAGASDTYSRYVLQSASPLPYARFAPMYATVAVGMRVAGGLWAGTIGISILLFAIGSQPASLVTAQTAPSAGDVLTYTISVINDGASGATGVVVEDRVPTGTTYVAGSATWNDVPFTEASDDDIGEVVDGFVRVYAVSVAGHAQHQLSFKVSVSGLDETGAALTSVENRACVESAELPTVCSDIVATPLTIVEEPPTEEPPQDETPPVDEEVPAPDEPVLDEEPAPPTPTVDDSSADATSSVTAPPEAEAIIQTEERVSTLRVNGRLPSQPVADPTPELTGVADPNTRVTIVLDERTSETVSTDAVGRYAYQVTRSLVDGSHRVRVRSQGIDIESATIAIDTVAPVAPHGLRVAVDRTWENILAGQQVTLSVQGEEVEPGAELVMVVQSDPQTFRFTPTRSPWQFTTALALDVGTHSVTVTAYDPAGNASDSVRQEFEVVEPNGLVGGITQLSVVFQQPQAQTAMAVTVPALTVVGIANASAAVGGAAAVIRFLGLLLTQPALVFARRRRQGYGVVFDALTKRPIALAVVRLRQSDSGRVAQTKVTDQHGRYLFLVTPGTYTIEVIKAGYAHPTKLTRGANDSVYADVQIRTVATVGTDGHFAKNIPLDPVSAHSDRRVDVLQFLRHLQFGVGVSGPAISAAALLLQPSAMNAVLLAVQFIILFIFLAASHPFQRRSFGVVRDRRTGLPVRGAVVRIFETTYNRLLETQLTDGHGRYAFLVGRNQYLVTVEHEVHLPYRSHIIDMRAGHEESLLTVDIALDPTQSTPMPQFVHHPVTS